MEKRVVASPSRIAIVDDDPSLREAVKGLLRSAGFHAETFASAEDALSSGRLSGADCLVLDIRMPGMSGFELQERLFASGALVPIVFVTAHGDEHTRRRALERGAVDCLRKPFSDDALLDAIARAMGTAAPA
ncbi:response regulator transcription factor [Anaeromyxobacter oryzae]|uniref:Response regulator n=1 Tax=Anaeromyxobacter oryzae TaxID=2918170 RepID=A0ABM7WXG5_9BACT|nr:response regulator [Anaeromyxobacter oryzae]BDG04203.1 response regulator [Anaeromyxobacter oryzae]